ncbi:unnamed protein product [Sphagnum troendelagicum]
MVQVLIGAEVEEGVQRVGLQHIALVGLRIAGGQECTFRHQTRSRNAKYGTGGVSQNGKIGGLDFPPWQQVDIVLDFTICNGRLSLDLDTAICLGGPTNLAHNILEVEQAVVD